MNKFSATTKKHKRGTINMHPKNTIMSITKQICIKKRYSTMINTTEQNREIHSSRIHQWGQILLNNN